MKPTIPTPDTPLQKMFLDSLVRNPEAHFSVYWRLWLNWGQWQLNGECWMLKSSAFPNNGEESFSSLASILEPNPDPRYFLSPKACQGMINRTQKQESPFPPKMLEAMENILSSSE